MMKITFTLFLVYLGVTLAYGQNRPGASIETAKKIREARPSFNDLVGEVDQLAQGLIELEIAITEANTARLRERNEDFRKSTEVRKENYEKVIELLEKIGQLKTEIAAHHNSLNQLKSEFQNRGYQLLQSSRDLVNAEMRLAETESRIQEMEIQNNERLSKLTGRMEVMEARIQSISSGYIQKTEYNEREKTLLARILFLEEANQTLVKRFQVSETLIQQLGEQIINNADQVATVNIDVINQSGRIELIQKQIDALDGLSIRLDSLTKKNVELDGEIIKIGDLGSRVEAIVADLYLIQNELLRIGSDSKKLDDVSKLTLEDLGAVLSRLDDVEINQITKLDSDDLNAILERLDELEIIQPELGDQYLLRDRVDELLYRQSLITEELERLNLIEDTLIKLEERVELNQMSSEMKEEIPASSEVKEETPASSEVKEETPASSEVKEEPPASSEVKEETPASSEKKEEVPMTQYPAQPVGE